MPRLRLAHCSDIHLEAGAHAGDDTDNNRYRAGFSLVLDDMLSHNPDLVLSRR